MDKLIIVGFIFIALSVLCLLISIFEVKKVPSRAEVDTDIMFGLLKAIGYGWLLFAIIKFQIIPNKELDSMSFFTLFLAAFETTHNIALLFKLVFLPKVNN